MIATGIIGASGYSGEELIRLLAGHPDVELKQVTSRALAGQAVNQSIPILRGHVSDDLLFTASDPEALAKDKSVDVFFLALPHGVATEYAAPLVSAGKTVIDLSADFRLNSPDTYQNYYEQAHPSPELLAGAPYVIPELCNDNDWKEAKLIACPGCYPTSILMPLIPLIKKGAVDTKNIVINSFSGVSGAGKKASEALLYCERDASAKAYGIPGHRHLSEIEEQLEIAAGEKVIVQFNPHLAPMPRGIITTITATAGDADPFKVLNDTYKDKPFVSILKAGEFPDSRNIANTNRIEISAIKDERTGNIVITSAIDNLLKGAGGQAVQIMNHKYGFSETAGLI